MNEPNMTSDDNGMELTIPEHQDPLLVSTAKPPDPTTMTPPLLTPAQARVEAVASVLQTAYSRASTLELTPEQVKALKADFPDEAFKLGAGGNPDLLYIEHAFLRDRFDEVIGMGQWALVRTRPHWAEEFSFFSKKHQRTMKGTRLYSDCALLIKGCLVSEAIGSMDYYPNDATNYGDAAEGSVTAAFRRCAKQFGVGLQAWKKDFCIGWMQRNKSGMRQPIPAAKPIPTKPIEPEQPKQATAATRNWMIDKLNAKEGQEARPIVTEFFQVSDCLLDTETLEDLDLRYVPVTQEELKRLVAAVGAFEMGDKAVMPYKHDFVDDKPADPTEAKPVEAWRLFEMPWGKQKGIPLGKLDKKYLYGLWANFKVETEYNGQPTSQDQIEENQDLRQALDAAGKHYEFTKND